MPQETPMNRAIYIMLCIILPLLHQTTSSLPHSESDRLEIDKHMDSRMGAAATHMNNFEPSSDLIQEDECDTLLLYLPGFIKEELRVQLTGSGALSISGSRPLGNGRWSSFLKDFPVSANCDTNRINAKFEGGILYVRQPKQIVPADKKVETPQPPRHAEEPPASKIDQEQTIAKKTTTPSNDQKKQTGGKEDIPEKSSEIKEEKYKDKSRESEDVKKHERSQVKEKIDKDQKTVSRTTSDKHAKVQGTTDTELAKEGTTSRNGTTKVDDHKLNNECPEDKLKKVRLIISVICAVLSAFLFGMLVMLPFTFRNARN